MKTDIYLLMFLMVVERVNAGYKSVEEDDGSKQIQKDEFVGYL